MALDEPIDIGNVYRWKLYGHILVRNMYVDEDGNTQIQVIDRGECRSVDAETFHELVDNGGITKNGEVDDYTGEPWTHERLVEA